MFATFSAIAIDAPIANDNTPIVAAPAAPTVARFKAGVTYTDRSACDYECIFEFPVVRRTAKSIWIKDRHTGDIKRVKLQHDHDGNDFAYPSDRYSMCSVIRP